MMRSYLGSFVLCGLAAFAIGCGDDSGANADARVVDLIDAGPADASVPDAFVCVETATRKKCGEGMAGCVDITRDNMNCGGCGISCASPGQACIPGTAPDEDAGAGNDVAYCSCPAPGFVPETITPLDLSQFGVDPVNGIPGGDPADNIAFGLFLDASSLAHAFLVTFNGSTTPVGQDIDLSGVTGTIPRVGAAYNVDIMTQAVQTPYAATEGTLHLDYSCATGVAGTLTNAVFVEVEATMNPTPVDNGCGFTVETVSFAFGDDCGGGMDAGVPGPDAGADANPGT
jgi:hypothetical protein